MQHRFSEFYGYGCKRAPCVAPCAVSSSYALCFLSIFLTMARVPASAFVSSAPQLEEDVCICRCGLRVPSASTSVLFAGPFAPRGRLLVLSREAGVQCSNRPHEQFSSWL